MKSPRRFECTSLCGLFADTSKSFEATNFTRVLSLTTMFPPLSIVKETWLTIRRLQEECMYNSMYTFVGSRESGSLVLCGHGSLIVLFRMALYHLKWCDCLASFPFRGDEEEIFQCLDSAIPGPKQTIEWARESVLLGPCLCSNGRASLVNGI